MKTILITGNKGFIGSYLHNVLEGKYNCSGLSRSDNIDISNYNSLLTLTANPDIIIHTAAALSDDIEEAFNVNVAGTLNICKYAKENNVQHLILISSLSIYDEPENEYFNIYGRTKKQAEEIAEAYCSKHNIKLTILRLSQVYDTQGVGRKSQGMLYNFIDTIQSTKAITLFGKKNPLRNYIHIEYVTNIIQDIIKTGNEGIFNLMETKNHTITEIAYMIFNILKIDPAINILEEKPDIGSVYIPIDNQYHSDIESISLFDGIKRIINYEQ